jgi:CheY-like chemotaxis protein
MNSIVAVVTDLFFQARINAAARTAGHEVRFASSPAAIDVLLPCLIAMVDLDAATDVLPMIRLLRARGAVQIVAFGPHVDTERRKAARAAGAHRVLAKSKFAEELPRLVAALDAKAAAHRATE